MEGGGVKKIGHFLAIVSLLQVAHPLQKPAWCSGDMHENEAHTFVDPFSGYPTNVGPKQSSEDSMTWESLFELLKKTLNKATSLFQDMGPDDLILVDSPAGPVPIFIDPNQTLDAKRLLYFLSLVLVGQASFCAPAQALFGASSTTYFSQRNYANGDSLCGITSTAKAIEALSSIKAKPVNPDYLQRKYGLRMGQDHIGRANIMRAELKDPSIRVTSGLYSWNEFTGLLQKGIAVVGGGTTSSGHILTAMGIYGFTQAQVDLLYNGASFGQILEKGQGTSPKEKRTWFVLVQDPWGNWLGGGGHQIGTKGKFSVPKTITFNYFRNERPENKRSQKDVERGKNVFIPLSTFKKAFYDKYGNVAAAFAIPTKPDPQNTRIYDLLKSENKLHLVSKSNASRNSASAGSPPVDGSQREPTPQAESTGELTKTRGLASVRMEMPIFLEARDQQGLRIPSGERLPANSLVIFANAKDEMWLPIVGVVPPEAWHHMETTFEKTQWLPASSTNPYLECSPWKFCRTIRETPFFQNGSTEATQTLAKGTIVWVDKYSQNNGGWVSLKAVATHIDYKDGTVVAARANTSVADPQKTPVPQELKMPGGLGAPPMVAGQQGFPPLTAPPYEPYQPQPQQLPVMPAQAPVPNMMPDSNPTAFPPPSLPPYGAQAQVVSSQETIQGRLLETIIGLLNKLGMGEVVQNFPNRSPQVVQGNPQNFPPPSSPTQGYPQADSDGPWSAEEEPLEAPYPQNTQPNYANELPSILDMP